MAHLDRKISTQFQSIIKGVRSDKLVMSQNNTPAAKSVVDTVFPKLVSTIRSAAGLASNDIKFYKSIDSKIAKSAESYSSDLLKLINQVVSSSEISDLPELTESSLTSSWSSISNIIDGFFEKSDIAFDELKKNGNNSRNDSKKVTYLDDSTSIQANDHTIKRLDKPQLKFKNAIDNSELHPFKPLLNSKPNSVVPFSETFELTEEEEKIPSHYRQPYETEILNQEYNPDILEKSDPISYNEWESTDAIWVDNIDTLNEMIPKLQASTAIAVDLEHHDYRSYYGLVCLMQISTRDQDWLIDTLVLRDDLQILNTVFTDPKITKVFHGAFMDIIWLQRDLGLYVVSLFDTYHASRQLGFPKHSLAYLLETFAHFKTSKKYQLADWRIRPLTKPMRLYARSDTHFLLYIFDQLRNMLIESNKLNKVLFESRNVALRRFEYTKFRPTVQHSNVVSPIEKAEPWKSLVYQYNIPASKAIIVKKLYEWRDEVARDQDESPRYIMPNQLLISLASLSPTDPAGVLASSNMITEHVRKNCKVIAELISKSLKLSEEEDLQLLNDASEKANDDSDQITLETVIQNEKLFDYASNILKESVDQNISGFNNKIASLLSIEMIDSSKTLNYFSVKNSAPFSDDLIERKNHIQRGLDGIKSTHSVESLQNDIVSKSQQNNVDLEKASVEKQEIKQSAPSIFENSDEIVVLKQKKRQEPKSTLTEIPKESEEKFDYTKAPKVIQTNNRPKYVDRKRPSTAFDPYSKESEGPKPAKKQQVLRQGKTTSFVNKKKKK